ncbi:Bug family tripartite tricarboxylate transporter substrate binding protein [Falsiroseomonas sp. CW058]|uniref:Bug family tripartite tricarboxylate transporter substrate binding protein n=1 Tax=Falsiroseomonas sp. CW058 TaxID=3388664 RepID=UPI003D3112A3
MERRTLLGLAAAALAARGAAAQDRFPVRPVRIVIPFAAGGSTDILARLCAQILTERLGQPVVAENVTGAGGTIGAQRVLDAPADSYTLMAGTPGPVTINPHLQPRLPYQPLRDFEPVVFVGDSPAVIVVRRDSPIRTLQDLVAQAKAAPGRMTYASAGIGSFAHLSGELFKWRGGLDMTHIPYRGTSPAATDIIGGRVDAMFENYPSVQGQISSGELRVLALGAARRSALLPGVPTVAEAGVPGYESTSWFGLFARAGTPPAATEAINAAVNAGIRTPAVTSRLADLGIEPAGGTPADFRAYIQRKLDETGELIRTARITAE